MIGVGTDVAGGCLGDIGTHAYHLVDFVTGLHARELAADLGRFVEGRMLDDNAHILLRYEGGVRGMLWASQVAPGNEKDRKSTRLNSSHTVISYAVFCLKK